MSSFDWKPISLSEWGWTGSGIRGYELTGWNEDPVFVNFQSLGNDTFHNVGDGGSCK